MPSWIGHDWARSTSSPVSIDNCCLRATKTGIARGLSQTALRGNDAQSRLLHGSAECMIVSSHNLAWLGTRALLRRPQGFPQIISALQQGLH